MNGTTAISSLSWILWAKSLVSISGRTQTSSGALLPMDQYCSGQIPENLILPNVLQKSGLAITTTSLTMQSVKYSCKAQTFECELYYGGKILTGGFDWCNGNRTPFARYGLYCGGRIPAGGSKWCNNDKTPTARTEFYCGYRTPTGGSDLADKIMGHLQRAVGSMVTKEC